MTHRRATRAPDLRALARFRYGLRRFLRFSERAARAAGLTPLQHQLLLGATGFTGRGWATISELSEFLQERHNAVVGLVSRAARAGLVRRERGRDDRRVVRVLVTAKGRRVLLALSRVHREELARFPVRLQEPTRWRAGSEAAVRARRAP